MSQNDSTPPVGTPGNPYGGHATGFSGRGTRFFDWMRGLGVVRSDGWLGGVCAGIAYRLGIDPLIVRGIVVVAGILGVPVLLLYAAAWALLPDRDGRIHLQRLFEGEFEPLDPDDAGLASEPTLLERHVPEPELEGALTRLRAPEREALFLNVVEGYTAREIAALTNQPRGTVLSLIHRAKQQLRQALEAGYSGARGAEGGQS